MLKNKAINLFASPTFYGVLFSLVIAINPTVDAILERGRVTSRDVWNLVYLLSSAGLVMVLRVSEGNSPIYTPHGILGPDKEDFATVKTRTTVKATTTTNADTGVEESTGLIDPTDYNQ